MSNAPPRQRGIAARSSSLPLPEHAGNATENGNENIGSRRHSENATVQLTTTNNIDEEPMSKEEMDQKMELLMHNPDIWSLFKHKLAKSESYHRSGDGLKALLREFLKEHVELQQVHEKKLAEAPSRRPSIFEGFNKKPISPPIPPSQISHQQQVIDDMLHSHNYCTRTVKPSITISSNHHHLGKSLHRCRLNNEDLDVSSSHSRRMSYTTHQQRKQEPTTELETIGKRMLHRVSAVATAAHIFKQEEPPQIVQDIHFNLSGIFSYGSDDDTVIEEGNCERKNTKIEEPNIEEEEYGDEPCNEDDLVFGARY